jgi:propionyl-CoA synthetase
MWLPTGSALVSSAYTGSVRGVLTSYIGSIEQAIASHPQVAECCVVGVPDGMNQHSSTYTTVLLYYIQKRHQLIRCIAALKGHLPFAYITLSTSPHPTSAIPSPTLFKEVQQLIRTQIGAIAALGGMIQGKDMIPKTRSGKTLRRVMRELVENAVHGDFEKEVQVPATVEDINAVKVAREKTKAYFQEKGAQLHKATEARAKL